MTIWAKVYKKSRLLHLVSEFMSLAVFGLIGPAVHSGFADTNNCLQKEAKLLRWDCKANSLKSEVGSHKQDGFLRLHLHQISVCLWFPSAMHLPDKMRWEAGDGSLSPSGLRMTVYPPWGRPGAAAPDLRCQRRAVLPTEEAGNKIESTETLVHTERKQECPMNTKQTHSQAETNSSAMKPWHGLPSPKAHSV